MNTNHKNTNEANDEKSYDRIVTLIHGIRTFGRWQELAKRILEENPKTKCVIIRYGYFDLFRFLLPFNLFRKRVAVKVNREIRKIQVQYPEAKLSVISHSFGSYIIARILLTEPGLRLHRLIICGGVVPDDYPWWLVVDLVKGGIRNDCSRKDFWPAVAKAITIGYGAIGTYGANTSAIEDRFHDTGHSEYFNEFHIRDRWRKFIEEGSLEEAYPSDEVRLLLSRRLS